MEKRLTFFHGKKLILSQWEPEVGCVRQQKHNNEGCVRVIGLPLHLWQARVFRKISEYCGGFAGINKDTAKFTKLQWARIRVKKMGKFVLRTLQLVVGNLCLEL